LVRFSMKKGEIHLSLHKKEDADEILDENEDNIVVKAEKA